MRIGYNVGMRSVGVIPLVVLGLLCGVARGQAPAEKAWRALFAQSDPAASQSHIQAVLAECGGDLNKLKGLIRADTAYPPTKPGWHKRQMAVTEGKKTHQVDLFVRVPKAYTAAKSWPMLLAAHWQGGTGEQVGRSMEVMLGPAVEQYVIVAPTIPDKDQGFLARPHQVQAYLQALAWARMQLNVDDDRVYVSGYDQGGNVCWHLAVMYPRLFAAAVPMAGMPFFQGAPYTMTSYLENLGDLDVWAIWGGADRGEGDELGMVGALRIVQARMKELTSPRFRGTELPGVGHFKCWPRSGDFVRFLAAHRRTAAAARMRHHFHTARHNRGYYLAARELARKPIDFDKLDRIEVPAAHEGKPTVAEALQAAAAHLDKRLFKLHAQRDPATNALAVKSAGVTKVRVYIVEGLFDLAKPVEIRFGKARWQEKIVADPRCVLEHYAATRDQGRLIYNEIDLSFDGKAAARYPAVRYEKGKQRMTND
jgi:dienelactone hydrolase